MSTGRHIWLLTSEHNIHDSPGDVFVAAFEKKPTIGTIAPHLGLNHLNMGDAIAMCEHVINGGGRQGHEDVWYNLRQEPLK